MSKAGKTNVEAIKERDDAKRRTRDVVTIKIMRTVDDPPDCEGSHKPPKEKGSK